jgi:hypothetical protein
MIFLFRLLQFICGKKVISDESQTQKQRRERSSFAAGKESLDHFSYCRLGFFNIKNMQKIQKKLLNL